MKILFLQTQPCIRAFKYATGLKGRGNYEITFGYTNKTLSEFYGMGDELFERWVQIEKDGVGDLVSLFDSDNFDLIHSHNAPDYLTVKALDAIRYAKCSIPIIHDNHDAITLRKTQYGKMAYSLEKIAIEESIANKFSDARIHVSEGLKNYITQMYGSANGLDIVFNNFALKELVPEKMLPKLSEREGGVHIVYEGNVDEEKAGSHYDLLDIFDEITKKGFHLHVYTPLDASEYKKLSGRNNLLHFHGRLTPEELMKEITQYDFGWAGFNRSKNKEHLKVTLANKVFEYISAGLPVISFPHETQKRFLESHRLGIVISSLDELSGVIESEKIADIKAEVQKRRYDFTIENNIGEVEEFYQRVLENHKNKNSHPPLP